MRIWMILLPPAAMLALALIYHSELGLRAIVVYGLLWLGGFLVVGMTGWSLYAFVPFQAVLAVVMYIHVKKNEAAW